MRDDNVGLTNPRPSNPAPRKEHAMRDDNWT